MNTSRLLPYVLSALIAGTGGYFLGRGTEAVPAAEKKPAITSTPTAPVPPRPVTDPAVLSAEIMALVGKEKITSANSRMITYRILSEADPVRRMTAAMVLLESMTPENAGGIVEGFREITKRTGRKHDAEWPFMLRRFGAVRGAEGIKELMKDEDSAGLAMEGLTAADPKVAEEVLKELGEEIPGLKNHWLAGLCLKDPQRALQLALSGKFNDADGKEILNQAISGLGVDKARDAMQAALGEAPDGISDTKVFKRAFVQLSESLFHKNWVLGTPGEMLPWLQQQKDEPYVDTQLVAHAVKDNFLAGDPVKTLDFLDAMNAGRNGVRGTHEIYEILQRKPEAVANLSAADCDRLIKYLHASPKEFSALVEAVEKLNPERAKQLRAKEP